MEPITNTNQEVTSPGNSNKPGGAKAFNFNPFRPEFYTDPYPIYHQLRDSEPVHKSFIGAWLLTRYADVKAVLRDPRFTVDKQAKRLKTKSYYLEQRQSNLNTLVQNTSNFLLYLDPPDHTRLRGLVSKAFYPGVVERMQPYIQKIANELIDKVRDTGVIDIIADIACPLPVKVIATMLGVPTEDRTMLNHWTDELSRLLDPLMSLEAYDHMNKVAVEFTEYFRGLIAERQKRPKEDLISALIAAKEQGDKLSEDEMVSVCMLLFAAGEETTVNLIGNGMLALLRHPDQMELLKQEPTIIHSAVEELLRYDSPVQLIARIPIEDVEIGGKTIPRGEPVYLSLGAANRDKAQFTNPDSLNLCRSENRHLAFSDDIHYCLGAALGRVEGQIAINTLIQRLPDLKLNTDKLEWRENILLRGLKSIPVTFSH